jgi:hypothetical protein
MFAKTSEFFGILTQPRLSLVPQQHRESELNFSSKGHTSYSPLPRHINSTTARPFDQGHIGQSRPKASQTKAGWHALAQVDAGKGGLANGPSNSFFQGDRLGSTNGSQSQVDVESPIVDSSNGNQRATNSAPSLSVPDWLSGTRRIEIVTPSQTAPKESGVRQPPLTDEQHKLISELERRAAAVLGSNERFDAFIRKTYPGAIAQVSVEYPSGNQHSAVATVDSKRNISLVARDMKRGSDIYSLAFQRKSIGWQANVNGKIVSLPENVTLDGLALVGVFGAYVFRLFETQLVATGKSKQGAGTRILKPLCYGHDDVCSPIAGKDWPWTGDHGHIKLWFPCIGSIEVDVLRCCKEHDTCLWCSESRVAALGCATAVVSCMIGNLWNQAWTQFGQLGWFAKIVCFPFILGMLNVYTLLGGVLGSIGELLISAFENSKFVGAGYDTGSCLCGGKEPTTMCYYDGSATCRDLCRERGIAEDCDHCKWKCQKDSKTGKLITVLEGDPSRCCPGSAGTYGPYPCDPQPDPSTYCPHCVDCWKCRFYPNENKWAFRRDDSQAKALGVPCCDDSKYDIPGINWEKIIFCP